MKKKLTKLQKEYKDYKDPKDRLLQKMREKKVYGTSDSRGWHVQLFPLIGVIGFVAFIIFVFIYGVM